MTSEAQWAANQKFLDRVIQRGDNVRLSVNVLDKKNISPDSYLVKELEYLQQHGYKISKDGWWLLKHQSASK
jgi:hypothetical protein